ncbi:hypothetical protein ACFFK0_06470 [Paenibacillus chartarius]|uniref:Uncharacterized protein n=1 Tax=Paenibacillus chartarius TaxID=747481 RepID=A0ABV6DHH4_9BACL
MFRRKTGFKVEGHQIRFECLGHKVKGLEIWYENKRVRDVFKDMPYSNSVVEAFRAYKEDSDINYQYLLITDNMDKSDNWFYRQNKVWVVTLKYVLETIVQALSLQNIDIEPLRRFIDRCRCLTSNSIMSCS